jgi:hypothetical protein
LGQSLFNWGEMHFTGVSPEISEADLYARLFGVFNRGMGRSFDLYPFTFYLVLNLWPLSLNLLPFTLNLLPFTLNQINATNQPRPSFILQLTVAQSASTKCLILAIILTFCYF